MKSRISSFKIGKELWRKQIWLFALTCLLFFVFCTISGMVSMNIMSQDSQATLASMQADFLAFFATASDGFGPSVVLSLFVVVTIFVGTAAGVNAFSYLHNKNKVDFYHAMPVSRTRLYTIQAIICLVDYLIPAVVFINLLLVIGSIRGLATGAAWLAGWKLILSGICFLVVCYAVASLAMLLTGRLIVGGLGVWTFIILGPVMASLYEGWMSTFMTTYDSAGSLVDHALWKYSPYAYPWNAMLKMDRTGLLISLLAGLILLGINLWIYRRRPSEAAGRSMAFAWPAAVIQIILTVVVSLLIGLFFGTIFNDFSRGWFAFGLIFGGLLAYVIIQIIYIPSIKKLGEGKWRLLVSGIVVCIIAVFSLFGLSAYDRKIPDQASIQDVKVTHISPNIYTPEEEDQQEDMRLPCDDQVYALLNKIASCHEASPDENSTQDYLTIRVRMTKTNGKEISRKYLVEADKIKDELALLYDYPEFKKCLYPSLNLDPGNLDSLEFAFGDMSYSIYNDTEAGKREELFRALKEDVMDLTSDAVSQEIPIAEIDCTVSIPSQSDSDYVGNQVYDYITIYPSFTRTLALLERDGKEIPTFPKNIRQIDVYNTEETDENGNYTLLNRYSQTKDIEGILPKIVPSAFDTIWVETDSGKSVEITTKDDSLIDCRYLK